MSAKFVVEKLDNKHGVYVGEKTQIEFDSDKHILVDRPAPNESCFYDLEQSVWKFEYTCPASIKQRRMDICNDCDKYNSLTKTCGICHCIMPIKTLFANFSCPDKKW